MSGGRERQSRRRPNAHICKKKMRANEGPKKKKGGEENLVGKKGQGEGPRMSHKKKGTKARGKGAKGGGEDEEAAPQTFPESAKKKGLNSEKLDDKKVESLSMECARAGGKEKVAGKKKQKALGD